MKGEDVDDVRKEVARVERAKRKSKELSAMSMTEWPNSTKLCYECIVPGKKQGLFYKKESYKISTGKSVPGSSVFAYQPTQTIECTVDLLKVYAYRDVILHIAQYGGGFNPADTEKMQILIEDAEKIGDLLYHDVLRLCTASYRLNPDRINLTAFKEQFMLWQAQMLEPIIRALPDYHLATPILSAKSVNIVNMPARSDMREALQYVLRALATT